MSSQSEPSRPFGFNCEKCTRHHHLLHLSPWYGGHDFQGTAHTIIIIILLLLGGKVAS